MFKGCRYLVLLAAFIVGLSMVAGVEDAEAAEITSVTLSTPSDSGALRGIDSVFVATVTVLDVLLPADSLTVVMYLVTTEKSHLVTETLPQNDEQFGLEPNNLQNQSVIIENALDGGQILDEIGGTLSGEGFVAVQKRLGSSPFVGDADSVTSATTSNGATFTWYGKVSAQVGEVGKVRVAAFALARELDRNSGTFGADLDDVSDVVISAASHDMSLDGDRPEGPDAFANAAFELDNSLNLPDNNVDAPENYVLDEAAIHINHGTRLVEGFEGGPKDVLGIGDSVSIWVKMGASANDVLRSDSLTVVADLFEEAFTIDKGNRLGDTLRFGLVLSEGLFADSTLNCCAGENKLVSSTFAIFYADKAGNRSAPSSDALPVGVTARVGFMVDTTAPVLDGEVVDGDTILPVSTDTITDGTLRYNHPNLTIGYPDDVNAVQWSLAEALDTLFITFDGADTDVTIGIPGNIDPMTNAGKETITEDKALLVGMVRTLDFTTLGEYGTGAMDSFLVADNSGALLQSYKGPDETSELTAGLPLAASLSRRAVKRIRSLRECIPSNSAGRISVAT